MGLRIDHPPLRAGFVTRCKFQFQSIGCRDIRLVKRLNMGMNEQQISDIRKLMEYEAARTEPPVSYTHLRAHET